MPKITALIHTHNDAERIGRALDSLRACDEVLVVDHASTDDTAKIARHHGATVKDDVPGVNPGVYAVDARHDWILCLLPTEAVGESLEASLFEWKEQHKDPKDESKEAKPDEQAASNGGYAFAIREETAKGWRDRPPEVRLVNRKKINWPDHLPPNMPGAPQLAGEILRFHKP
jgi:glycosyltransferase involved in cell wall biosynthesis